MSAQDFFARGGHVNSGRAPIFSMGDVWPEDTPWPSFGGWCTLWVLSFGRAFSLRLVCHSFSFLRFFFFFTSFLLYSESRPPTHVATPPPRPPSLVVLSPVGSEDLPSSNYLFTVHPLLDN